MFVGVEGFSIGFCLFKVDLNIEITFLMMTF